MAFYIVRSDPHEGEMAELRKRLAADEFADMRPFGQALTKALQNARYDPETGEAVWEEEDYCSPPLAQERAAVLDDYFDDIQVEEVNEDEGWEQLDNLPSLWSKTESPA